MSTYPKSLLSGLVGAAAVTALNEGVRRAYPKVAPHLEKLGMDAAAKTLKAGGVEVPAKEPLYWGTMVADIVSNAFYYSVIGMGHKNKRAMWGLGIGLGLAAGAGAVLLPEPLDLDASTTGRSRKTKALTVAWYVTGAIIATSIIGLLTKEDK